MMMFTNKASITINITAAETYSSNPKKTISKTLAGDKNAECKISLNCKGKQLCSQQAS